MFVIRLEADFQRATPVVWFNGTHSRGTCNVSEARRFLTRNEANRVAEFVKAHMNCFIGDAKVTVEQVEDE